MHKQEKIVLNQSLSQTNHQLEQLQCPLKPEKNTSDALNILMLRAFGSFEVAPKEADSNHLIMSPAAPLAPVMPPSIPFGIAQQNGALAFSNALGRIHQPPTYASMNPDQLLSQFLKLQIVDPNNSVETHQNLQQAMSELRQLAIDEAQARIARAEEQRKEAEAYAAFAQIFSLLISIITLALSFITAGLSFGIQGAVGAATAVAQNTAAQAAQQAAQQVAQETAKHVAQQAAQQAVRVAQSTAQSTAQSLMETINPLKNIGSILGEIARGIVNGKSAEMTADARQQQLMAERMRHMAELFQSQLEEEGEIIEMLMTSKNQAVDAVLRMLNANFASNQKIMMAGMAR